jgi:hypothetical protein
MRRLPERFGTAGDGRCWTAWCAENARPNRAAKRRARRFGVLGRRGWSEMSVVQSGQFRAEASGSEHAAFASGSWAATRGWAGMWTALAWFEKDKSRIRQLSAISSMWNPFYFALLTPAALWATASFSNWPLWLQMKAHVIICVMRW